MITENGLARKKNLSDPLPEFSLGTDYREGTVLAFTGVVLEHTLSEEEHSQIVQTIEMFEVITQTQPDDYQSLEILKEAYQKVGRTEDSLKTSRRLAEAYFNVGSYTLAMQECEVILLKEPNAPEILAMLGDIETRLQASGHAIATSAARRTDDLTELGAMEPAKASNRWSGGRAKSTLQGKRAAATSARSRRRSTRKVSGRCSSSSGEDEVNEALETVNSSNKELDRPGAGRSLLDYLCRQDDAKDGSGALRLIDRTKFALRAARIL